MLDDTDDSDGLVRPDELKLCPETVLRGAEVADDLRLKEAEAKDEVAYSWSLPEPPQYSELLPWHTVSEDVDWSLALTGGLLNAEPQ